jgi:hypothetical protein
LKGQPLNGQTFGGNALSSCPTNQIRQADCTLFNRIDDSFCNLNYPPTYRPLCQKSLCLIGADNGTVTKTMNEIFTICIRFKFVFVC